MKIFGSFDSHIITQCQWFSYCLDMSHMLDLHRLRFLSRILSLIQLDVNNIFYCFDPLIEKNMIMDKYGILSSDSSAAILRKISNHFGDIVSNL